MMSFVHETEHARVDDLARLAGLVAFSLRAGDTIALEGDLGAGKTTFARALIRAALDDETAEVPSPTFSLVQTYDTPRMPIAHADLYRLADAADLHELGLDDVLQRGAVMIEWPERAGDALGDDLLEIEFCEDADPDRRTILMRGLGSWRARLERIAVLDDLMRGAGWRSAHVSFLQGDASPRRYARIREGERRALLMDAPRQPDGPPIRDGLPYSRIAHLAEDVRAFVGVQKLLAAGGLAAPAILAADIPQGALIIENLGDRVYGREVAAGADMLALWRPATEVLVRLRGVQPSGPIDLADPARYEPVPRAGESHTIPPYDKRALSIETELLPDWYWPLVKGEPASAEATAEFLALWSPLIDRVLAGPQCLTLRDYHSPNLLRLEGRGETAEARVGIIDFQDAVIGHPAYDLVSLLQDARLDVPEAIETELLAHYCRLAAGAEPAFDEAGHRFAYAVLGAQRNTKILGIFARLWKRDGKPQYLAHVPRIWRYLARDLAHPELGRLRAWYDTHFPADARTRRLGP